MSDPDEILERMEELVAEASEDRGETTPLDDLDPIAEEHRETIRDAASE